MGFPYGYYPPPYPLPSPWYQSQPPGPPAAVAVPTANLVTTGAKLDYPKISHWLNYCDTHPDRRGEDFVAHIYKFDREGFRRINQLTGDRVTIEKLSDWLKIGKGTADLLIQYAEEDVELIKNGMFTMRLADREDMDD